MKGTLYIVSTPLGNLEDITFRAVRILKEVDVIAAEDTRHTLKLLNHYGIARPLISYWGEREKVKAEEVIGKNIGDDLAEGKPTLPLIYAMRNGTPQQDAFIRRAIEDGGRDAINQVVEAIESTGAIAYTAGAAQRESEKAMAALEAIPSSPYKDAMYTLAAFAVQRNH